jgi:hypothetical protein
MGMDMSKTVALLLVLFFLLWSSIIISKSAFSAGCIITLTMKTLPKSQATQ